MEWKCKEHQADSHSWKRRENGQKLQTSSIDTNHPPPLAKRFASCQQKSFTRCWSTWTAKCGGHKWERDYLNATTERTLVTRERNEEQWVQNFVFRNWKKAGLQIVDSYVSIWKQHQKTWNARILKFKKNRADNIIMDSKEKQTLSEHPQTG